MGQADVQQALLRLAETLDRLQIPYAVMGAMALNEWGYRRVTVDVDVLLTAEGLARLKAAVLGRGYVEKFPGSRGLRDVTNDVGKVLEAVRRADARGELELEEGAAKAAAPRDGRGRAACSGSGNVLEVIRALDLPRDLGGQLDASVRNKYDELWQAAQVRDPE